MFCGLYKIVRNVSQVNSHNNLLPKALVNFQGILFSTKSSETFLNADEAPQEQKPKKKTPIIPKITLLHHDNIEVVTLEEAQKISKRRDLKLVKVIDKDTKTQRAVYKLMSGAEYLAEDLKNREKKKQERSEGLKGEKVLILGSEIAEHDLNTQMNKVLKWIGKRYEVKVVINGIASNMEKAEMVYKYVESALKDNARILQKRTKGSDIRFQAIPPKSNKENMNDS